MNNKAGNQQDKQDGFSRQSPVLVESHGEVITITLNRPDSFNAIDYPTALALRSAIDVAAAMPGGRVVVLRGAGKSFCGGGDVLAMHANRADLPGFIDQMIDAFHASVMALSRLPMPVIASVHGAVAGGGFSLAMACDLIVSVRSTRFVVAYPHLGAPADGGLSFQLTQRLGRVQGFEALTLHGNLSAEKALSLGLVNRVVDAESADAEAYAWAQELVALPVQAVNELKELVAVQSREALKVHLAREKAAFLRCATTLDFTARAAAFAGKQRGVS
jgi:2-(1,2-epoxy-1,2-dihydrophenyl)acetyl-CoA isomerase